MNSSKSDNGSKLDDDKKFSEYRVYDGKKLTPILLKLGIEADGEVFSIAGAG